MTRVVEVHMSRGTWTLSNDDAMDLLARISRGSGSHVSAAEDKLLRGINDGLEVKWTLKEKRAVHETLWRWRANNPQDSLSPGPSQLWVELARELKLPTTESADFRGEARTIRARIVP